MATMYSNRKEQSKNISEAASTVGQRMIDAARSFVETVTEIAGCTEEEAARVLVEYKRLKIVRLDAVGGRYRVTHGSYFDEATIWEAIRLSKEREGESNV